MSNGVVEIDSGISFVIILAIILFFTKLLGLIFRKIGLPQVLGYIIAGILIGPAIFGELAGFSLIGIAPSEGQATYKSLFELQELGQNGLEIFSKIGVLLLLFSTGLETNLKDLKKTGLSATIIAILGVVIPLGFGILMCLPFDKLDELQIGYSSTTKMFNSIFIGLILTATSVAVSVSVLKELGKINTKLGTTIISAAIIDDVIGIVLLSVISGISKSLNPIEGVEVTSTVTDFASFKATWWGTLIMIICFFIVAIAAGFGFSYLFRWLEKKFPNTHRLPIFSLVVCFLYSFVAEEVFGVADITGAFLAGVVLSTAHKSSLYTDKKIEVNTYTFFAPVFFANIGISSISFKNFQPMVLLASITIVIVGCLGKILGCGAASKMFKYNYKESAIVGVGMMARGEVALIVTDKAVSLGLNPSFTLMTVLLILISSILTPILLKVLFKDKKKKVRANALTPGEVNFGTSDTDSKGSELFLGYSNSVFSSKKHENNKENEVMEETSTESNTNSEPSETNTES